MIIATSGQEVADISCTIVREANRNIGDIALNLNLSKQIYLTKVEASQIVESLTRALLDLSAEGLS